MALVLHELATNAAKYGGLSEGGRVSLAWWREGEALVLRWRETGGPLLTDAPKGRGFGGRMIDTTVRSQLGGSIERHWLATGLACEMTLPLSRISPAPAPAPAAVWSA
jgi:two-component sensor histidine kinase